MSGIKQKRIEFDRRGPTNSALMNEMMLNVRSDVLSAFQSVYPTDCANNTLCSGRSLNSLIVFCLSQL